MSDKIYVESMVKHTIGFQMPNSMIKKEWNKKGSKLSFDREALIEAYSIPGVAYMFENGMLYTDDMDFKKEVGLEPEDATTPVNIVKLDDATLKRMVGPMPAKEFEEALKKLSFDQKEQMVAYLLDHQDEIQMAKVDMINKACDVNLLKAVELRKAANEPVKEE